MVEERPEIVGDLWALYRLDFWEEVSRPRIDVLMQCVKRLALEPNSVWRAQLLGGEKWFGWDMNSTLIADLIDATAFQTNATAVNKKAKPGKPIERPKADAEKRTYQPKRVKDVRLGAFFGTMIQQ